MKRKTNIQAIGNINNSIVEKNNNEHSIDNNPKVYKTGYAWMCVVALILSVFSIVLSIISLAIDQPVINKLDFDYYGAIIGVLSVLVCFVVGWNILSALNIKSEVDKLRSEFDTIKRTSDEKIKNATAEIITVKLDSKKESIATLARMENIIADFCLFDLVNIKRAISHTLRCMLSYDYIGEDAMVNKCAETLIYIIKTTPNEKISPNEKDLSEWISLLKKIDNREKIDKYDTLYSIILSMNANES